MLKDHQKKIGRIDDKHNDNETTNINRSYLTFEVRIEEDKQLFSELPCRLYTETSEYLNSTKTMKIAQTSTQNLIHPQQSHEKRYKIRTGICNRHPDNTKCRPKDFLSGF